MKLKTRIIISFLIITLLPICLSAGVICILGKIQTGMIEKNYGITDTGTVDSIVNPTRILSRMSENSYTIMKNQVNAHKDSMDDVTYLEQLNEELEDNGGYLIVRKNDKIIYIGESDKDDKRENTTVISKLPSYGHGDSNLENGVYIGGSIQVLVKQYDFRYTDGSLGTSFLVVEVGEMLPEVKNFLFEMLMGITFVLILVAFCLMYWIYSVVMRPLKEMQKAAQNIRDGNLDFELVPKSNDELGRLTADLEDMRKRLKETAEEKLHNDKESKELISNISHDLKTPVTAIKGYAEGILDGVADTPEKQERYLRTIYNKAVEMDRLINELTLYSKIDTNRIPYNFQILSANRFFEDCAEDLNLEMQSKNARFEYANYVDSKVSFIADPEQLERVIHNIVNNSMKYMDKSEPRISLRVKDVGDFIQIELEDNGKGIAAKDLQKIFDRFYRTDASRNSSKGGSGIGLSIVKKIVEEHGGSIWVTSKEGVGTILYFVLRKYQEVPANE